jgi:hypothetical protein
LRNGFVIWECSSGTVAISITGREWESNFEWVAHSTRAVQHGMLFSDLALFIPRTMK